MGINNLSESAGLPFKIKTYVGKINEIKYPENQPFINGNIFKASIINFKLLTTGDDVKQIYEIWFETENSCSVFEPGDTIAILAPNREEEVDRLISRLKLKDQANLRCDIEIFNDGSKKKKCPIHIPTTETSIHNILTYFIELRAVPKKQLISALCEFTSEDSERQLLETFCTSEYENQIVIPHLSVWHVLQKVPSCQPPLELILEHLPRLRPRPYSIASSSNFGERNSNQFRVIFFLEELPDNQTGLVSGWLVEIAKNIKNDGISNYELSLEKAMTKLNLENNQVSMYLRKIPKPFRLPKDLSKNLIMIGAGTGLAPFIGFLEHLSASHFKNGTNLGEIWLICGCRYSNRDEIYKNELETFLHSKIIKKIIKSYSRDGESLKYVQDNILLIKEEFITQFLKENTVTYVCGNLKLCKDIYQTIINMVEQIKGISFKESKSLVDNLKKTGNFIEEIWV